MSSPFHSLTSSISLSSLLFAGTQLAVNFHYTESDCVKWYIFQEVGTQLLVAAVEFILIIRGMPLLDLRGPAANVDTLQVHALYDRNRRVTATLFALFLVENVVMIVTLIKVVPEVHFDAICTVIRSPSDLIFFAYDYIPFNPFTILTLALYSVAFVSFETVLFVLTLFKFLVALRNGWGRTPVIYLLVRDGTWAFILIFGSYASSFLALHFLAYPCTTSDALR
jgi:hypothetical protein